MPPDALPFLEWFVRSPWGLTFALIWGALWGSFANVCIYRLPKGLSLLRPASRCPLCHTPIAWYDNIPVLSFVLLRGKCRRCQVRIGWRYPLVELLSAGLTAAVFVRFVDSDRGELPTQLAHFVVYGYFALVLLVLSAIDLEHMLLPDRVTLPSMLAFFCAGRLLADVRWMDALLGMVAGYGVIWLIAEAYYRLTGREGLGLGDGKLLALVGSALGWQALPWTVCLGSVLGSLIAIPWLWLRKRQDPTQTLRHIAVPFGPFLALGAVVYLLLLHGRSLDELARYVPGL
jgi:leader peptidase (prepilin peptidase)/N-methyltransferase